MDYLLYPHVVGLNRRQPSGDVKNEGMASEARSLFIYNFPYSPDQIQRFHTQVQPVGFVAGQFDEVIQYLRQRLGAVFRLRQQFLDFLDSQPGTFGHLDVRSSWETSPMKSSFSCSTILRSVISRA